MLLLISPIGTEHLQLENDSRYGLKLSSGTSFVVYATHVINALLNSTFIGNNPMYMLQVVIWSFDVSNITCICAWIVI